MPTRCIAAKGSKTTLDGVSLQSGRSIVFFQCCAANNSTVVLRIRKTIHHTFDMKRKGILKHDTIPTIFLASGTSKKVPERRDELKGAFA